MSKEFEVILTRPARDSSKGNMLVESRETVHDKQHELNLAKKILREDDVPWVEAREARGRFKFRVSQSTESAAREPTLTVRAGMKRGAISLPGRVALVCWFLMIAQTQITSKPRPTNSQLETGAVLFSAALLFTVCWAYGRAGWAKNKMRAEAYREGRQEAEDRSAG